MKEKIETSDFVARNFDRFKSLEGSQHIATFSSQLNFVEVLKALQPLKALDFGSGIGTFIPLILNFSKAHVWAVERNSWCRNQFIKNAQSIFPDQNNRVILTSAIIADSYNVIVIDDDISRSEIHRLLRNKHLKLIFIEGWRKRTVGHISRRLLFFGYSAIFIRGESRLSEFNRVGQAGRKMEKAGSWFLLEKDNSLSNFKSWLIRIQRTHEIQEMVKPFYFWLRRSLSIRSFINRIFIWRNKFPH
jgi:hypothetical protein